MSDPLDDPRTSEAEPEKRAPDRRKLEDEAERKLHGAEEGAERRLGQTFTKKEALGEAGLKERGDEEAPS